MISTLLLFCFSILFIIILICSLTTFYRINKEEVKEDKILKKDRVQQKSLKDSTFNKDFCTKDFDIIEDHLHKLLNLKNIKIKREELKGIYVMSQYFKTKEDLFLQYFLYHGKNKTPVNKTELHEHKKLVEDIVFIMQIKPKVRKKNNITQLDDKYMDDVWNEISKSTNLYSLLANFSNHKCLKGMKNLKELVLHDCNAFKDILNFKDNKSDEYTFLDIFLYKFLYLDLSD